MSMSTTKLYDLWRDLILRGLAHAEAVVDFGDDEEQGVGDDVWGGIRTSMQKVRFEMEKHLSAPKVGELTRNGLKVGIIGPTNAGKSSLLNLLAEREAAIVSPFEGTTRDVGK